MPKQVVIRARSNDQVKTPDLQVQVGFPTLEEAYKAGGALAVAFEHAAHATFAINTQTKMRVVKASGKDPQATVSAIDWATMGTRQRGGLTPRKIEANNGALASKVAAGKATIADLQKAIDLQKAGNLVELEKMFRAVNSELYVKNEKKAAAPAAAAPAKK